MPDQVGSILMLKNGRRSKFDSQESKDLIIRCPLFIFNTYSLNELNEFRQHF